MQRAVFLDRDGTIIEERGLITKKEEIKLFPYSAEAIKLLNSLGLLVIIVTNQPQVARGLCTEKDVEELNKHVVNLLNKHGAKVDAVYYCPHHPERKYGGNLKYRVPCDCRKPAPGMLLKAAQEYRINLNASFMIGDSTRDIAAGKNAGCRTILVKTGYAGRDNVCKVAPDYICENLLEAAKLVERLVK